MYNDLIVNKKLRRIAAKVCMNCGFNPCVCAISKLITRHRDMPDGIRRFKKRPKGGRPK